MPKDKGLGGSFKPPTKRSKDDSDSDSGPEVRGGAKSPVKKSAKTEPAAKSPVKKSAKADPAKSPVKKSANADPPKSPVKKSAKTDSGDQESGINVVIKGRSDLKKLEMTEPLDSGDPSWPLGNMKWAKVSSFIKYLCQIIFS